VGPYCKPDAKAAAGTLSAVSAPSGSMGFLDVKDKEVIGNVLELGLPASIEIMPGRSSSGKRPRTNVAFFECIGQQKE
jgi:hypothetical protein